MVLGGIAGPGVASVIPVTSGFLSLVLCVRRALLLWNVDGFVFEKPPRLLEEVTRSLRQARSSRAGRSGALRLFQARLPAERH